MKTALFFISTCFSPVLANAQSISKGLYDSFSLCDSTVKAWGYGANGELGNGAPANSYMPVPVSGLSQVTAVSGGDFHTMALKRDSSLWAWGLNGNGQLGNGNSANSFTPVPVNSLSGIVAMDGGSYFSIALKSDGTVWTWGSNQFGQLGTGNNNNSLLPVQVASLTNVVAIAAGNVHALALKSDSTVWQWGWINQYLPFPSGTPVNTPVQVSFLSGIVAISGGGLHSMALKSDGTVWSWGVNTSGQLGNGNTTNNYMPVQAVSLTGIVKISAGIHHSLALKNDGTVWQWGWNQLSNSAGVFPLQVSGLSAITDIAAGLHSSLVKESGGNLYAWGVNDAGQLGNGDTLNSSAPVRVINLCANTAVGIPKNSVDHNLSIYPNPSAGIFYIKAGDAQGKIRLTIYNTSGETVYDNFTDATGSLIDLGTRPKGIYFCCLQNNEKIIGTKKIVIE